MVYFFKAPNGVVSTLEKFTRDFLWSGSKEGNRDHLMSWEVVCRPREEGGLGLGNMESKNVSLLGKCLWRFPLESNSLWHNLIRSMGINRVGGMLLQIA